MDETMDPENEGKYRAKALRCHACGAREIEARKFAEQKHSGGLRFAVEKET